MEEKKKASGVAVGMCIFIMIILVFAIFFLSYKYKTDINNKNEELASLNSNIKAIEDKVSSLENEKESISSIIDETDDEPKENQTENKINNKTENKTVKLEKDKLGMYITLKNWPGDAPTIELEDNGKIYSIGNASEEGTYIYDGNELQVNYNYYTEPGSSKKISEDIKTTIKFVDDNIIEEYRTFNNEKEVGRYLKSEYYEEISQKAQECIDNQNNIKVEGMGLFEIDNNKYIFGAYIKESEEETSLKYIVFDVKNDKYTISEIRDDYEF